MRQKTIQDDKVSHWLTAIGISFGVIILSIALFSDDFWEDEAYEHAPPIRNTSRAPHKDGREKMVCSSCHQIIQNQANTTPPMHQALNPLQTAPPIQAGTRAPHRDGRERQPCRNCHSIWALGTTPPPSASTMHPTGDLHRFQGTIQQLVEPPGAGILLALVNNGINRPHWIALRSRQYLFQINCPIGHGAYVKGDAFRLPNTTHDSVMYTRVIAVNGKRCFLRNNQRMEIQP
ncbi:magnetochrome domain-containing protein [Magnetococcales bacterium HHB-1]